uniref:Gamma-interferon-inducible lysosomal thiol reductase n=1 Tax=Clastoptera arizonana TaxID=38151 RepID=A0A1B6E2T5_9HEMI
MLIVWLFHGFLAVYALTTTELPAKKITKPKEKFEIVNVTLYYESLCPFSRAFIMNQLSPVYNTLKPRMSFHLVPYGLTKRKKKQGHWVFMCQHGQEECNMDVISGCAVEIYEASDPDKLMDFIVCLEDHLYSTTALNSTIICAKNEPILLKQLAYCFADPEEMMLNFARKTENVKPEIRALPAIQINEDYIISDQRYIRRNLYGKVCDLLGICPTMLTTPRPQLPFLTQLVYNTKLENTSLPPSESMKPFQGEAKSFLDMLLEQT